MNKRRMKENQLALGSADCNLSRGFSASERIADDVATEMMLCENRRQIGSGPRTSERKHKKDVLVCITHIASHSSETDVRVFWEGDIFQSETVTPFIPC